MNIKQPILNGKEINIGDEVYLFQFKFNTVGFYKGQIISMTFYADYIEFTITAKCYNESYFQDIEMDTYKLGSFYLNELDMLNKIIERFKIKIENEKNNLKLKIKESAENLKELKHKYKEIQNIYDNLKV